MEETNDVKEYLIRASAEYKEEIQEALKTGLDKLGKTGVNALVITGALGFAYLLVRGLTGEKTRIKNKENEAPEYSPPSMLDKLAERVVEQTVIFLLTLAKEKLTAYLTETASEHDNTEGTDKQE
ncbi:MAG: hypothetical protein OEX02_20050 [Cyclobacteriaceae bacterium]|nr:hypothetical protein [Cyclobacteriaceae bacterium]